QTQADKSALRGSFWALLDLIPNIMIGLVLLLGALAVSRGELSLGGLVAYITLALLLVWPIQSIGYLLASGQEAATAAPRGCQILCTVQSISDPGAPPPGVAPAARRAALAPAPGSGPSPVPASADTARGRSNRAPGQLTFDHVAFSSPGGGRPVLRDVSLVLEP